MARSDRCDQSDPWGEDVGQQRDVPGAFGAKLEQADLRLLGHREQGQREADLRVVVARGAESGAVRVRLTEQMGEERAHRRLPVAAGDPDERGVERLAPGCRQALECRERVVDENQIEGAGRRRLRIGDQGAARSAGEGVA